MKFCLALLSLAVVAHGTAVAAAVATVVRSQVICEDEYTFEMQKSSAAESTTFVLTADSNSALQGRMVPKGLSAWPATLTVGTQFTVTPNTATGCGGTADTTATAAYASGSGALTVTTTTSMLHLCLKLKKMCTLVYSTIAAADWVFTSSLDTTAATTTITGLTSELVTTGAKMTSAPFAFTPTVPLAGKDNVMTVTPAFSQTAPPAADKLTITMTGFTQAIGSVCSINDVAYSATTAASVDKIIITLAAGKLLVTTNVISCTKIQGTAAAAATVPNGVGLTFGTSTDVDAFFYAASPVIATSAPTAAFSSAPSTCANVLFPSLLALVAATLLA